MPYPIVSGIFKESWSSISVIWIRIHLGPWIRIRIQRYKSKVKAEFNQQFFALFFSQEIIFFKSEPKKVANLLRFRFRLENYKFFVLLKDVLISIWWFYWPGSGLDPDSWNFWGSGSTTLPLRLSQDFVVQRLCCTMYITYTPDIMEIFSWFLQYNTY